MATLANATYSDKDHNYTIVSISVIIHVTFSAHTTYTAPGIRMVFRRGWKTLGNDL